MLLCCHSNLCSAGDSRQEHDILTLSKRKTHFLSKNDAYALNNGSLNNYLRPFGV